MDTNTDSPAAEKNRLTELDKKPGFLSRTGGYLGTQIKHSAGVAGDLATAPFRGIRSMGHQAVFESKRIYENAFPTAVVGLPLTMGALALGLGGPIAIGFLTARAALTAGDDILVGICAGAFGFLVGTAIAVFFYELALALAAFELLSLVARVSAARKEAVTTAPASPALA